MTRYAEKLTVVHLRDIPYEVNGYDVYDFFSAYGEVLTIDRTVSSDYPSLCDENQIVEIVLRESLPCFLTGCGVESRILYREQPPQCFVCRELGHRAQACPFSGLCRCCRRPVYKARECSRRVWDPAAAAAASFDSLTSVSADPVSVFVASVPFSATIDPDSIIVDKPLAVVSIPANAASVPAPVVVDPAPIIVYEPLVVPVNAPVSDPVLVTEPVSPTPDVPVTDTNISVYYSSYRAPVAQLDEHWAVTREVMSSTPVLWSGITHSVLGAPVNSTCYIKKIVNCAIK